MDNKKDDDVLCIEMSLYGVFDKVARAVKNLHFNSSDGAAIRQFITTYGYYGEDFEHSEPLCFGRLSLDIHQGLDVEDYEHTQTGYTNIDFSHPRVLRWSDWRQVEDKESLLDPLGLSPDEKREVIRNSISSITKKQRDRERIQKLVDAELQKEIQIKE